jgi:anti-anti-sigma factor
VRESPDSVTIELRGTLDVFLAARFADAAVHCVARNLDTVLDCSALERLDASALQVLLALQHALSAKAHRLELSKVTPTVASYLAIAGFVGLLT